MEHGITFFQHRLIASLLCSFAFVVAARAQVNQTDPCAELIGHMSPRQHEHSKLYSNYDLTAGKDLCALAGNATDKEAIEVQVIAPSDRNFRLGPEVPPPPSYPNPYLVSIAYGADAVILGEMKSKASALTKGKAFVFTDFQMNVLEVIKDNVKAPIGIGSDITVTRPGGTLEIAGKEVCAADDSFKPFQLGGQYVLLLEYIPVTGAYRAYADQSFQLLLDGGVAKLTTSQAINLAESRGDAQRFLNEVRAAVGLLRWLSPAAR